MIPEVPRRPPSIDPRIPSTPGSLPLPGIFFIYHIYRVPIENVLYSRPVQYKPKI